MSVFSDKQKVVTLMGLLPNFSPHVQRIAWFYPALTCCWFGEETCHSVTMSVGGGGSRLLVYGMARKT